MNGKANIVTKRIMKSKLNVNLLYWEPFTGSHLNGTQAKGATKMGAMIIFLILEIISLSLDYY